MAVDVEPLELGDLGSISIDLGSVAKALQLIAAHQNATAEKAAAAWGEIEQLRAQFEEKGEATEKMSAQLADAIERSDAMAERLRELEGRDFEGLQGKIDSHDKAVRELKEKIVGVDPSVAKLELQQAELLSKFTVLENKVSENGDAVRIVKTSWEGTVKPTVEELNGKVKELTSTVNGVVEDVEHVRKDINQKYGDSLWSEIRSAVERVSKKEFKEVEQRIELNSAKWHERSKQLLTYTRDHILTAVACEFHQRRLQHHVFSLWFQSQWQAIRRRAALRKVGKIFHDHQRAALRRWRQKAEFEGLRDGVEVEVSGAKQEVVNLIKHDVATLKESVEEGMKLKVDREEVELRERDTLQPLEARVVEVEELIRNMSKESPPDDGMGFAGVSSSDGSSRATSPREVIEGKLSELRDGLEAAFEAVREVREVWMPKEFATKEMVLQCTRDALELHKLYQQLEATKADRAEMDGTVLETQNHLRQLDASIGGKVELLTTQLREVEEKARKLEGCYATTETSLGEQKEAMAKLNDTLTKLAEFTQDLIDRFVGEGSSNDNEGPSSLSYMVRTGGGFEPRHFVTLGASGQEEPVFSIPGVDGGESRIDRYLKHARNVIERAASASSSRMRSSSGGRTRSRSRVFRTPPSGGNIRELIQPAGAAVTTPVGRYIRGVGFVHTN